MGSGPSCTPCKHFQNDVAVYCFLFNFFILVNKYVLSGIGFKFPAVFQGWQALVSSAYLLRIKRQLPCPPVSPGSFHKALDSLLFIAVIVLGSKALSAVPVPLFLCVQNVPMLCYLILSLHKVPLTEFFIAITGLASSLCLFIFKDEHVSDDGIFWLIWYCIVSMIFETYFQSDDSPNKEIFKNYYRNILSVGVLLIWIIVSEEGESAIDFSPREDAWFFSACCLSGLLCAVINAFAPRSRFNQGNIAQAIARIPPLFLSLYLFPNDHLTFQSWNLIALNILCALLLSVSIPQQTINNESIPIPI